jgi:3-deoxy-D-manno-octulosonic-acid transferase
MEVMYTPLDFWPVMRRAFAVIQPERILLVEAEVWPNFVAEACSRKIPVALVNARLSPRSERRFRRFRTFVAPLFQLLDLVCVPEPADVDRWASVGVPRARIRHTGSIKYDPAEAEVVELNVAGALVPRWIHPQFNNANRLVLFGGSTHSGEEEILARIFLQLRQTIGGLLLFLAPRHVERALEIKQQLEKFSLGVTFCGQLDGEREPASDCYLLDRTGELQQWYSVASVVFVGKSLSAIGGQNPVEPIVAGKPVMFGPHMENFATLARELVNNGGAIEVRDESSLFSAAQRLLSNPQACRQLVENARRVVDSHRGATLRTAELVINLKKSV